MEKKENFQSQKIIIIGAVMKKDVCCPVPEPARNVCAGPFWGRVLISLIFIIGGLSKIFDFGGSAATLRGMGIDNAVFYVLIGLLLELIGGILLILGLYTRIAVYLLMIFLLPTTFVFHSFWLFHGSQMVTQFSTFLRNLAIYGGLLLIWSWGPGCWSLDHVLKRRNSHPHPHI